MLLAWLAGVDYTNLVQADRLFSCNGWENLRVSAQPGVKDVFNMRPQKRERDRWMEKKTTKRQLECLGRRWTMINYTTHDKTFICICTKFSREDEDKLPNDSHSFAPGCCFFLLDRRRHKSDLAMPWDRHRVLRLLWMVFNILLPLCNSVDGWSLLGGVSYSGFWQQFRVMCVLITQHLQSWCAKVPWSWLVVSGRNATRSELWTDRRMRISGIILCAFLGPLSCLSEECISGRYSTLFR